MPGERLWYLESLRGIAALVVALFHAQIYATHAAPFIANDFFARGYLMVDFFFVLSGFVIAMSSYERLNDFRQVFDFQIRRLFRLYPLHLATLAAFCLIEFLIWPLTSAGPQGFGDAFAFNDGQAFLSNLFLVQTLTEAQPTFNRPAWSLSAEVLMYGGFAIICLLARPGVGRDILGAVLLLASAYILWPLEDLDVTQGWLAIARCGFSFFAGVAVWRLHARIRVPAVSVPLLLGLIIFGLSSGVGPDQAYPVLFIALIMAMTSSADSAFKRALSAAPLVRLGTLSFGIYLWHGIVFWLVPFGLAPVFGFDVILDADNHNLIPVVGPWGATCLLMTQLIVTYLVAAFTFDRLEQPMIRAGRRFTSSDGRAPQAISTEARSTG